MSALCIRVPALRGPLPGEAPLSPAAGCCPVLRLWPGLPEEFSRPAAGGLTASGRRAVTVTVPAPQGPWHMPDNLPFSPREAAVCLDDLQRMGDAALSGQPVGTLGADVGKVTAHKRRALLGVPLAWRDEKGCRARRNSAESALRAGLMADGTLETAQALEAAREEREKACAAQRMLLWSWLQEERLAELQALSSSLSSSNARLQAALDMDPADPDEAALLAGDARDTEAALATLAAFNSPVQVDDSLLPAWPRLLDAVVRFAPADCLLLAEGRMRRDLLDGQGELAFRPLPDDGPLRLCDADGHAVPLLQARAPLWRILGRPRAPRCCPGWQEERTVVLRGDD